ncbi:MAG: EAL domain-containing protein [Treponema sp.]|nr:EAL domain-containing protein [Treponema sp.]
MKVFFLVLMCLLLSLLPVGIKKVYSRKNLLSIRMFNVLIPASLSVISHIVVILANTPIVAKTAYSLYFASATWISTAIFSFCVHYSGDGINRTIYKFIILPLTVIDSIALIANIFMPFMFSVYFLRWGKEFYMHYYPSYWLFIHFAFGNLLLIYCFFILLRRMIKTPPSSRIRYYAILISLVLIVAANLSYILARIPFNLSILVYAGCFIATYIIITITLPKRLIQKTLSLIADNLSSGIVVFDNFDHCLYLNSCAKTMFHSDEKSIMQNDFILDFITKKKDSRTDEGSPFSCEMDFQTESERRVLLCSDYFIKEFNKNEAVSVGHYFLIVDITSSKNQLYEEKMLRTRDRLTNLYNQEYFYEKVEHRLKFDRFTPYYLIITDIVNFKLINDLHGKPFGDMILMRLADSIRKTAAPDDIYGRLYNDHFVMFVPKRHFDEEEYIENFKNTMQYMNNFSYTIIGHMGIYEVDDISLPISVMCDRAFLSLRTIKNDYKTTVAYYDDRLRSEVLQMQMLMNELPPALKFGQLVMYLQPQCTKDHKVVGAEALVRWHHPSRGVIPPAEFIEIIEKINIISDVDRYIWECACKKLSEWKKSGHEDLCISVNISAKDFFTMDLYETFTGLVKKYDISPKNLNLEITETAVIMDLDNQVRLLDRLRNAGFVVEMDDFGSGYSSLNMLKDISVDVLKIDMAFLQKSKNDEKSKLILEKIIVLAKELGMRVVTEGVETGNQMSFLSSAGCDLFQGFYFSRPIPVSDFEEKYFKGN